MTNTAFQRAIKFCEKIDSKVTSREYRIFLEYTEAARDNLPRDQYEKFIFTERRKCIQRIYNYKEYGYYEG